MHWTMFISDYSLFILKLVTLVFIPVVIFWGLFSMKQRSQDNELVITDLSKKVAEYTEKLKDYHLDESALKQVEKQRKKANKKLARQQKAEKIHPTRKPHLFVLDFKGDIVASQTSSLREEISAIIAAAQVGDEVLLRLESPGGIVTGYGLAASQLTRLKKHQIPLIVAVDKIAASGGYMMACVADKIIAAPFAILGSIGVVAQVPNIHRLLKKHDIDVDVMTAGEYKRTVTLLGENTEKGKAKFQQELEETHTLFKNFVTENRPTLNLEKLATGEHWFGQQALALNLIDKIATSDDLIMQSIENKTVLALKFKQKKSLLAKISKQMEESSERILMKLLNKQQDVIS